MLVNPIYESIEIFLKVKGALDKLKEKEQEKVREEIKKKLRSRAREIPEMLSEIGIVPTLTFCLAKAGKEGCISSITLLEKGGFKGEIKEEELAYGIYAYVILTYLSKTLGPLKLCEIKEGKVTCSEVSIDFEEICKGEMERLCKYLSALLQENKCIIATNLLIPYLIQFKRLCEAEFPPEK